MKTKIILLCLLVLSVSANLFANTTDPDPKNVAAYNSLIRDYIDSHMNGDSKTLNRILDENASYKIPRGEKVMLQGRNKLIEQMRKESGVQQNCKSDYQILAASDALVIAKVDFTYGECLQSNYVTLEKSADKTWKITQVCKFFGDVKSGVATTDPLAAAK
ncbi:MAG: hypothetical protein EOP46_11215 [Sphingobacteriaceae bacterium]|nr:MAG: hypothetical protein EOP46_11215 [Sphingobacteriaceae bacterium]